jgi:serine/threonine-protein kinase RsbW
MEEHRAQGRQAVAERGGVTLSRTWSAVPSAVGEARRAVAEHARALGATPAAVSAIQLAVSEAMTNAVQHAYADDVQPGPIAVTVEAMGSASLCVIVADEGRGMRPRPDSPGLGLGLPLISQMTQSFEVHSGEARPGTELSMRFDLHRGVL